jgi:hypothetical protein|tara:strand:- start:452 stop:631 length:180 start_codon:yes stop_codon:yes gene_type:complete
MVVRASKEGYGLSSEKGSASGTNRGYFSIQQKDGCVAPVAGSEKNVQSNNASPTVQRLR